MTTPRIAWPCAGDGSFKFLPYQLSMFGYRPNMAAAGKGGQGQSMLPGETMCLIKRFPLELHFGCLRCAPRITSERVQLCGDVVPFSRIPLCSREAVLGRRKSRVHWLGCRGRCRRLPPLKSAGKTAIPPKTMAVAVACWGHLPCC